MKTLKQLKKMTLEKRMMYYAKHSKQPFLGVAPERSMIEKIDNWGHRADVAFFGGIAWLWKNGEEFLFSAYKLCLPGLFAAFILWLIYHALTD